MPRGVMLLTEEIDETKAQVRNVKPYVLNPV